MGFSFNLGGVQDTINKLRDTRDEVTQEIDMEIAAGAELMARTAKQLCPVQTGKLRGSISASKVKFLTWELVAQTDYAAYVEFGTGKYVKITEGTEKFAAEFKGKGKREVNRHPKPYFFPAYFYHRKEIIKNIITVLNEKRQ